MKELISDLKNRQPSSDDFVANALMRIATFCDNLATKHDVLVNATDRCVERITELENEVSNSNHYIKDDISTLKSDVSRLERSIGSVEDDVRHLERSVSSVEGDVRQLERNQ